MNCEENVDKVIAVMRSEISDRRSKRTGNLFVKGKFIVLQMASSVLMGRMRKKRHPGYYELGAEDLEGKKYECHRKL